MKTKRGLPYGWWKNPDVWAAVLTSLILPAVAILLLWGWFL